VEKTLLAELAQKFLAGTATEQEQALLHQWFDSADKEEIELVFLPERETEDEVRQRILGGIELAIAGESEDLAAAELGAAPVEFGAVPALGAAVEYGATPAPGAAGRDAAELGMAERAFAEPGAAERALAERGVPEREPVIARRRIGGVVRWVAAASILLAVGGSGLYIWNTRRSAGGGTPVAAAAAGARKDLLPGGNKATLLLGDGSMVNLGTAQNGVIRQVAGTRINKQDGRLVYSVFSTGPAGGTAATTAAAAPETNTIETPRGGQYQVVLPDGTKVWLNAASSLTYPTAFTGKDRQVQLKGEAYFEVTDNKNKPFVVTVGEMRVNVLGTHFNVMAYDDETAIKTTLLEGAVKVTKGPASHLLQSGQQASLDRLSGVFKILDVNVEEVVAWKNGVFEPGGETIEPLMREMARWYDVDVEYQGNPTEQHFRGSISRSANASEVFKMLELTGAVHFTIEGKKVIVRP